MSYSNYQYSDLYQIDGVFFTDPEVLLAWVVEKKNAEWLMGYSLNDCTITVKNADTFITDGEIVLAFTPSDEAEDEDEGFIEFTFHGDAIVRAVTRW